MYDESDLNNLLQINNIQKPFQSTYAEWKELPTQLVKHSNMGS